MSTNASQKKQKIYYMMIKKKKNHHQLKINQIITTGKTNKDKKIR